jgi:FMN reductase
MTDLLGIVGSVSSPSRTKTAVKAALDGVAKNGVDTELIHFADYDLTTADGRMLEEYEADTADILEAIVESDAYIFGTPVYRASYSGILKNLFDMIPRGQWQADVAPLENSAVGLVATGASPHHYLTVDNELRPVMAFFGAQVAGGAYLHSDHIEKQEEEYLITDEELQERLETLGQATTELAEAIKKNNGLASLGPQI